uniref:Uncharacterized protein n=1 Tax=Arundo donax TaxID=35708 RepID=A0A0A9G906_ARUDO
MLVPSSAQPQHAPSNRAICPSSTPLHTVRSPHASSVSPPAYSPAADAPPVLLAECVPGRGDEQTSWHSRSSRWRSFAQSNSHPRLVCQHLRRHFLSTHNSRSLLPVEAFLPLLTRDGRKWRHKVVSLRLILGSYHHIHMITSTPWRL